MFCEKVSFSACQIYVLPSATALPFIMLSLYYYNTMDSQGLVLQVRGWILNYFEDLSIEAFAILPIPPFSLQIPIACFH
jgi:hypothetical protein